jgi:hypothetical protein
MFKNVLKKVLLVSVVAAAIALSGQQASAMPAFFLTENCDGSIPFGTTTIHVNGAGTNINPYYAASKVTVVDSDEATLLGPITLLAGTNYGGCHRPSCLGAAQLEQMAISRGRTEQIPTEPITMNGWELAGLLFFFFAFGWWTMRELY